MKFGIFTIVPYHEDFTQQQALTQALEQIQFADEAGLDEVWLWRAPLFPTRPALRNLVIPRRRRRAHEERPDRNRGHCPAVA